VSDGAGTPWGLFGVLVHALHYTLLYGGLVVLALLLLHSRPPSSRSGRDRRRPLRSDHDRRVARLREAAARGGLAVPTPRHDPEVVSREAARPTRPDLPAEVTWLPVVVVSSAAAAGVHAAVGPAHFQEGLLVGTFFAVTALAQLGWALALLVVGPRRHLLVAALAGNAAVVVLWLTSRTVGVPLTDLPVEPVGAWDLAATGWEVAVVLGVSLVLASPRFPDPEPRLVDIVRWSAPAKVWLAGSVVFVLVLTVAGTSG
jgi:hypothetical protein